MAAQTTAPRPARRRNRFLKVLLVIFSGIAIVIGGIAIGSAYVHRAQGTPEAVEFADAAISSELADATVLALGEATHGNAEFQCERLALVQKLPQFRAIMLEEDFGNTALVNDFIQGGPGTAQDAARQFGFHINHTEQMAELLQWLRDHNAELPADQRIRLVGIDTQRTDASKQIALDWLAEYDAQTAEELGTQLAGWNDDSDDPDVASMRPVVGQLTAAVEATPDTEGRAEALNAAAALNQHLDLVGVSDMDYSRLRAEIMADNAKRTVDEESEHDNEHSLLFAHNAHVEKTSVSFGGLDLGGLLADEYGDRYRAIGTDLHHSTLISGQGADRWQVKLTNPTPLRGIFAGTSEGYLEFFTASAENQELLNRPVRMASAGERFQQWQAWIPLLNSVKMTPSVSYDALILVERATPVTPL